MKVLVCGGRDYGDWVRVFDVLGQLNEVLKISKIIHGNAPGADKFADTWAKERRLFVDFYTADWKTHGRAAGPIRNQRMLDEGKPDLVVAFHGGRGTADMVRRAKAAGVRVLMA